MINIAVVGLGYWGPNLLRNFSQLEGCTVKYGCDLNKSRLEKYRLEYSKTAFTENYEEVVNDVEVNLVAISTPVCSHYELAKKALIAGKNVFIEKPMASTVSKCQELIKIAEERNLFVIVDHTFLFTGAVEKIRNLIDAGELGDLYYFDSERINLGLIQKDINVIWDLAPHDISIMNYVFHKIKAVSVFATGTKHLNQKVQEMAHLTINFENGLVGHIHVSWLSPVKIRKILIGGNKKMLYYNDLEPSEKIKIYDKGVDFDFKSITPQQPAYRSGDIYIPKLSESEALKKEAIHVINCIAGKEKPLVSGQDGLDVVRILEACDRSLKEGRFVELY